MTHGMMPVRPRDPAASRVRAEVLIELKRLPEALRSLDECVKRGPADAAVFRARAGLRTRTGDYSGAQADYEIQQWLRVGLEYLRISRDSNFPSFRFVDDRITARATVQF